MTGAVYTDEVARLYELEHAGFEADLHLYRSYVRLTGGPILELGCGTGRVMLPFLRDGYRVAGVDASGPMLDRARRRFEEARVSGWELIEGKMAELDSLPEARIALAICALNTWTHLAEPDEALAVLRAVHRVLHPAGLLVLDLEDPARHTPGRGELLLGGVFRDGDDVITKTAASLHDPATGTEDVTVIWDRAAGDTIRRTVAETRVRPWGRAEMEQLLARASYEVRELLGSWELEPYRGAGDRMVVVAERR